MGQKGPDPKAARSATGPMRVIGRLDPRGNYVADKVSPYRLLRQARWPVFVYLLRRPVTDPHGSYKPLHVTRSPKRPVDGNPKIPKESEKNMPLTGVLGRRTVGPTWRPGLCLSQLSQVAIYAE